MRLSTGLGAQQEEQGQEQEQGQGQGQEHEPKPEQEEEDHEKIPPQKKVNAFSDAICPFLMEQQRNEEVSA